jgi:mRNA-degrading endonuclease YafQ of YafQ-DinJ toxin-antitoxin module
MALLVKQSERFDEYLENQRPRFDYLDEKLLNFLKRKIEFYNQNPAGALPAVSSYDKPLVSVFKGVVPGETLRHMHLAGDTNLVYSIVQSGEDKTIKLYGVFSHKELGTDPHRAGKITGDDSIIKTLANLGAGTWTDFSMGTNAPEVPTEKIDNITVFDKKIDPKILSALLIKMGLKIPDGTPIRNQLSLFLREPNFKEKLVDYNNANPIGLIDVNGELYLKDHNDVHLLFLLKRIGKSNVAAIVSGDRRKDDKPVKQDQRNPVSEEDDSNMSWEEILNKYL